MKDPIKQIHEALAPYIALPTLRTLIASGGDIRDALKVPESALPDEVRLLLPALVAILTPNSREKIKTPSDIAALFLAEMRDKDQEELWVVCLDTKNRIQRRRMVYKGSVNASLVRIVEIFKPAMEHPVSTVIMIVHNHPSGDPTPSPEDVVLQQQITNIGHVFDVDCLDHLIIGHGRFVSMRERGLGFNK